MLRAARPELSIGFFLHTPFPSSEVYRLLPAREQLLRGVLGADYVSFQIGDYARHFRSSFLRILGIDSEPDCSRSTGARSGSASTRSGSTSQGFRETLEDPRDRAAAGGARRASTRGSQLVLGVERLDYTKGIPHKLHAFERFLERDPSSRAHDDDDPGARAVTAREPRVPARSATRSSSSSRASTAASGSPARRRSSTSTATSRSLRSSRSTGGQT